MTDPDDLEDHGLALPDGEIVDDYEIRRVLGAGGFGITYLAFDHRLHAEVALKEYLPADFATRSASDKVTPRTRSDAPNFEWGLARFLEEARMLRQIDHPNVVRVLRHFDAKGTGFIVMEYVSGATLEALVEEAGPWDEARLRPILSPLLGALKTVHACGLLHRDLKPSNIMIRPDGRPVLIDFGAARQAASSRSRGVTAVVSPGYGPIEQYSTKSEQGPYTDIYGLAATAYFALTGEEPAAATDRTLREILVPATEAAKTRASPAFLRAIDNGLKVTPASRPQTVDAWEAMFPKLEPQARKPPPPWLIPACVAAVAGLALSAGLLAWLNQPQGTVAVSFEKAARISAFPSAGVDADSSDSLWNDAAGAGPDGFALATTAGQGAAETAAVYLLRTPDQPPTGWVGPAGSRGSAVAVDGSQVFAGGDQGGQALLVALSAGPAALAAEWTRTLGAGRIMGLAAGPRWLFACIQSAEGQGGSRIAILQKDGTQHASYAPTAERGQIDLHRVISLGDGGVAVGWLSDGAAQSAFAARFDSEGREVWRQVLAQPGKLIRANGVVQDRDGLELVGWRRQAASQDAFFQGLIETLDPETGRATSERVVRRTGSILLRSVQPAGEGKLFVAGVAFDDFLTNKGGSWWVAEIDRQGRVMDADNSAVSDRHQIAESLAWNPSQGLLAFGFSALGDRSRADPEAALYPLKAGRSP